MLSFAAFFSYWEVPSRLATTLWYNNRKASFCCNFGDSYTCSDFNLSTTMIRAAKIGDALSIAQVQVDAWRTTYVGQVPDQYLSELSVPKREASWSRSLLNRTAEIFIAEHEGTIQGFISVGPTRDPDLQPSSTGEVYAIYLRQNHQRRGMGQTLWNCGTQALRTAAYRDATVWVLESNLPARTFYEKRGCTLDGSRKTLNIGGRDVEEVRYRVSLK